jgi:hypothetical protein
MDFSGHGDNLLFRSHQPVKEPYYYISAQLDLSGKNALNKVYYFNKDNNFSYMSVRDYAAYYKLDDNSLISEVVAYCSPDFAYSGNLANLRFSIGGVQAPSVTAALANPPIDIWGGPTGSAPGVMSVVQLENAQSCHFGSEPDGIHKFLAVKLSDTSSPSSASVVEGQIYVVLKVYPKFG